MELSKEDGEGGARGEEAQRARGGQSKESGHLSSWTPNVNASEFVPSAGVVDKQLLPLATFTPDTVYMIGYWTPTAPTMPAVPAAEQPCTDRSAISGSTTVDPAAYGHEFDSLQLSDSTDPNVVMGSGVAIDSDLTNPGVGGFIGYPGNTMSLCTNAHPGWASVHSQMNESGNAAPAFVPSSKFCGAHPGWVFKSGEHGVGYYSEPLKPRSRKARARTRAAAVREHESEPGGQGNVTKVVDASSKQVIAACGNGDVGNTLLQQAENLSSRVQEWPVVDSSRAIPGGKKEDNDGKVGRHGAKRKTKTRDGNRLELANGVERTTADRIQSASAAPALAPTPSSWADHIRSRQRQPSSDVQERRSHDVAPTPERWMPRNHKVTPRVIHDAAVDKADHAVTVPPLLDECASGPSDAVPSAPRQPPGDSPSCAHHQATRPSWASAVSHASMQPSGSSPAERASSGKRETAYGGATTQALAMYIQSAAVNLSADESEQDGHGVRASQKGVETSRTEKAPMLGAWARRLPAVTSPALGGEHISNVNSKLISAPKGALSGMAEERNLPSSSQRGPATACAAMASVADAEGHLLGSNAEQSLGEKRQGPLVGWVSASKNGSKSANEGGGRASSSIVDDRKTLHWSAQGAKVTGSVRGSSTGAPLPNPPGSKPKPQKSVSLFDFLDLAKPDRLAPSTTAKGPILSARGAHGGRSLSAPRAREVAAEGSGSAGGGVVGLGRTQRRGKEKEGPRKIRLSKMKKTILTELLEKHGVSHLGVEPAPSVGAPLRLPEFNELESRAKARIAEEDLKSGKASESATKALDAAEEMAGRDSTVIGPQESAPKDEESGDGPLPKDGTSQQVSTGSSAQLKRPPAAVANSFLVREYVDQIVAPCINDATKALLAEVQRFQERLYLRDPIKANMKKRYVCGLREVARSLKANKAKVLIIAHNIERIEAEAGLDDAVAQLLTLCVKKQEWVYDEELKTARQQLVEREKEVLVVYALTRKSLSKALKRSAKTSVVAILNYDGATEQYSRLEALVVDARRLYAMRAAPWLGGARSQGGATQNTPLQGKAEMPTVQERFLVQYLVDGKQVAVDPLVLQPGLDRVPGDENGILEDDFSRWIVPPLGLAKDPTS